jgi:hypothetical protein
LEKPGAPTVAELQQMKDEAEKAGVDVLMGYNKVSLFVICLLHACAACCDAVEHY